MKKQTYRLFTDNIAIAVMLLILEEKDNKDDTFLTNTIEELYNLLEKFERYYKHNLQKDDLEC